MKSEKGINIYVSEFVQPIAIITYLVSVFWCHVHGMMECWARSVMFSSRQAQPLRYNGTTGKDRDDLLARLGDLVPSTETSCYGWALLSNHAHFLFRTGEIPLSNLMRRLLTGYVVSFNRRYRRHGPLFQNPEPPYVAALLP